MRRAHLEQASVSIINFPASVAIAGASAGENKVEERSDPDADGSGLKGMVMHGFIGGFRAFDCFAANLSRDVPGVFQGGSEMFAGFRDFFPGHVGGGGHHGARIFGQRARVMTGCVFVFVHIFHVLCLTND
jgi:hypothetical protein